MRKPCAGLFLRGYICWSASRAVIAEPPLPHSPEAADAGAVGAVAALPGAVPQDGGPSPAVASRPAHEVSGTPASTWRGSGLDPACGGVGQPGHHGLSIHEGTDRRAFRRHHENTKRRPHENTRSRICGITRSRKYVGTWTRDHEATGVRDCGGTSPGVTRFVGRVGA